ncbi:DUF1007 family protein [Marinomonas sp.]
MKHFWLALVGIFYLGSSQAHPHVWVDSQYQITVDQPQVEYIQATWSFDLFTSTSLIVEYDVDANAQLSGQEKVELIEVLSSFDQYNYFIKMVVDGYPMAPKSVDILDLGIKDQMLWVSLRIQLPKSVDLVRDTLSLAFGDDELYFAMVPLEEGLLRLSGAYAETCTLISREAEEMAVESWVDLQCSP